MDLRTKTVRSLFGAIVLPCSIGLGSTFALKLIKKIGEETGKEARKIGRIFRWSPGMIIYSYPLCGRNFEYYSQEPFLTGKMASSLTQGAQSKRVSITLIQFEANNN